MANVIRGFREDGSLPTAARAEVEGIAADAAEGIAAGLSEEDAQALVDAGLDERGLLPGGSLPSVARAEVEQIVAEAAPATTGGGFYLNEDGEQVPYVMVVAADEPDPTIEIDGTTYEVWWVQTAPPDPHAWMPQPVVVGEGRSYVVPVDAGAVYTVDGVVRSAGTYGVAGMDARTLAWSAAPRSGYSFGPGAVSSGSLVFAAKTYGPGDVVFSDSFDREGFLAGSSTDSFDGGDPLTWVNARTEGASALLTGGAVVGSRTDDRVAVYSWDDVEFPVELERFDFYMVAKDANPSAEGTTAGVRFALGDTGVMSVDHRGVPILHAPTGQSFPGAPGTVTGDRLRIEYRSGSIPVVHNLTRGTVSSFTETFTPTPMAVDALRMDLRPPNNTPIGTQTRYGFDQIKVVAQ